MTDDLSSKGETDGATPRPWRVAPDDLSVMGAAPVHRHICGTVSNHVPTLAEMRANARLIVRAVNSHDALVAALEDIVTRLVTGFPDANEYPPVKKARSALSLARGQTPGDTSNG